MRFTDKQLDAVIHAVTSVTCGDSDGWEDDEWEALEKAEERLKAERAKRDAADLKRQRRGSMVNVGI